MMVMCGVWVWRSKKVKIVPERKRECPGITSFFEQIVEFILVFRDIPHFLVEVLPNLILDFLFWCEREMSGVPSFAAHRYVKEMCIKRSKTSSKYCILTISTSTHSASSGQHDDCFERYHLIYSRIIPFTKSPN